MFFNYNLIGCWIATILLVSGKVMPDWRSELSWIQVFYPVLIFNAWIILAAIWRGITTWSRREN